MLPKKALLGFIVVCLFVLLLLLNKYSVLPKGSNMFVGGSNKTGSFCMRVLGCFYIKNISSVDRYTMNMLLVTPRITYCLSGSGKINAFLS